MNKQEVYEHSARVAKSVERDGPRISDTFIGSTLVS
jgi:hypothetical protein